MKYSQTLKNLFLFNCDLSQNGKGRLMKMQKRIVTIHNINKRKKERKKEIILYYCIFDGLGSCFSKCYTNETGLLCFDWYRYCQKNPSGSNCDRKSVIYEFLSSFLLKNENIVILPLQTLFLPSR
jgi:hypothetical protein